MDVEGTTIWLAGGGTLHIPHKDDGCESVLAHHDARRKQWRGRIDHWLTRLIGDRYVVRCGDVQIKWTFKYRTVKARTAHGGGGGQ